MLIVQALKHQLPDHLRNSLCTSVYKETVSPSYLFHQDNISGFSALKGRNAKLSYR